MDILAEIVGRKRKDVAARMAKVPFAQLREQAQPTTRRLFEALKQPGLRFILECKKASPSEGCIRPDFDITTIAEAYRDFADAVSILTDTPYFHGSFDNLKKARATLTQPILCKDFIIEPYQIFEARTYGADAVLLMLSVLDDANYRRCAEAAQALSMDILTEVHDEEELDRALSLNAQIVGINNRNLKTMEVDLSTTARLAPKIPKERLTVSESGIKTRGDIDALSPFAKAFLIGTPLMKEARVDLATRNLVFGRIKICGLTTPEAARVAYAAGASLGGVIFSPESPRCVSEERAREVVFASPLPMVGVFVNDALERIARLAKEWQLAAIQLHGEEPLAYVHSLREVLPVGCEIWKAVHVGHTLFAVEEVLAQVGADRLLLETFNTRVRGGSGKRFDWGLLRGLSPSLLSRLIVAGGLTPENVVEAHGMGAYAMDINSGVESAPGEKNPEALKRLFAQLRGGL
ncbi:MAG: bifunctional indole-3-glycerol-phosphate synthase TrpC/phosphoribosylanthranilate isomerase TrpF [Proteobacteria bacterium]|nr:bifunctional indole-3-glycerol-phosphate synthase TrpC/phosphoribosylanthranilate isomerase TrpF [Cystobacterineae bacterium]MCL2258513.1 bifunctional indole-3-glycerol-phosphate synthase TrpC/phosphoribosylanthranilate isomerase TrpF [Cystobacterineae bacterium]MCL2315258.1 bifunctional indole-3-glycerol-phosphate synthase TrpC/phosphoribosylanthranilate isomerase TrpF [Pseudomonadota bacterium]